jgi:hypothetical protein
MKRKVIMSNFSKIKIGAFFTTLDGETYKKTSELTFDDTVGIEHYIDPFIDKKIGPAAEEPGAGPRIIPGVPVAELVPEIAPKSKKATIKKSSKKKPAKKAK